MIQGNSHDRKDEPGVDGHNRANLPDAAGEGIGTGVVGFGHRAAETHQGAEDHANRGSEAMWKSAKDVLMQTVPIVNYRTTQAIQAYASIVHNKACVVHKFRLVGEAVRSAAEGVEKKGGEELCPHWPHVRVMQHVKLKREDPASVHHGKQGDKVSPDIHAFIVDLEKAEQVVCPWLVNLSEPCFHVRLMKHPRYAGFGGGRN